MNKQLRIPIAVYEPDKSIENNKSTDTLNNVFIDNEGNLLNVPSSYKAVNQPDDDRLTNLFATPTVSGDFSLFAGSDKGLYVWSNLDSKWIQKYTCISDTQYRWDIVDFKGEIYAAKQGEPIQYWNGTSFVDLQSVSEGTVPNCGAITSTSDFLVAYRDSDNPDRVYWSGIKDGKFWKAGERNSGFEQFTRGGFVTCVKGNTNLAVFTLRMTYKMIRTGGDTPWSFKLLHDSLGVYDRQHCCLSGSNIFFNDTQSYWVLNIDTDQFNDIGKYKVSNTWKFSHSLRVVPDVLNRRAYFVYPLIGTLIFNEASGLWSTMEHEGLDVFIGNFTVSSLDDMDSEYSSVCLYPYNLEEVRDVYSCALAMSKPDGIYLLDDSSFTTANIKTNIISDEHNSFMDINNIKAITDGSNTQSKIDYNYKPSTVYPLGFSTSFISQSNQGYSNFRVRCYTYTITTNTTGFKFFNGWQVNTTKGY